LSGGLAAVDDHGVTDGERCSVGAEPQNRGRDLAGPAHAADRLLLDDGCPPFVVSPVRRIIAVSMMPGQIALMRMFDAA
jgi:hypothetical protein